MITENNPVPPNANVYFRPGQVLRADDLNKIVDGVNRAGKLSGGGRAFSGGGPNPTAFVPTPPAITRGFWAKVRIPSSNDYPDERYFVFKQRATGGEDQYAQITREDDEPPDNSNGELNEDWPITATNNAEIVDHTHNLPDGSIVWVTAELDISENPQIHYSFSAGGAGGEQTYTAKIEAICDSTGGLYKVSVYIGPTTLVPADCTTLPADVDPGVITFPAGMTIPPQFFDDLGGVPILLLAVHVKEIGLKTHWLKVGTPVVGTVRMSTNGYPVLWIQDGYARDDFAPTLTSGDLDIGNSTPPPDSWLRNFLDDEAGDPNQLGNSPIKRTVVTRVGKFDGSGLCDPGRPETLPYLEFGMRTETIDAQGHVMEILGETTPIRINGCCPPSTSLASPSFASESDATYARALSASVMATNALG